MLFSEVLLTRQQCLKRSYHISLHILPLADSTHFKLRWMFQRRWMLRLHPGGLISKASESHLWLLKLIGCVRSSKVESLLFKLDLSQMCDGVADSQRLEPNNSHSGPLTTSKEGLLRATCIWTYLVWRYTEKYLIGVFLLYLGL